MNRFQHFYALDRRRLSAIASPAFGLAGPVRPYLLYVLASRNAHVALEARCFVGNARAFAALIACVSFRVQGFAGAALAVVLED
jgi:hypothetical protein